jgi:hypothetical protein
MKVYDNFQHFWNDVQAEQLNAHHFHDWQVAQILHTPDETYQQQAASGLDELGFQPLSVTFANPFLQQSKQVLVKHVDSQLAHDFREYCRKQYIDQLPHRFGSFTPDSFHAFAEYDNWESFNESWLERQDGPVYNRNLPLLFDHTPKIEYWTRKQTGQEIMPYQRLLVTTFFPAKNQFFTFFVKQVDDGEAERVKLLTQSRISLSVGQLFA